MTGHEKLVKFAYDGGVRAFGFKSVGWGSFTGWRYYYYYYVNVMLSSNSFSRDICISVQFGRS